MRCPHSRGPQRSRSRFSTMVVRSRGRAIADGRAVAQQSSLAAAGRLDMETPIQRLPREFSTTPVVHCADGSSQSMRN